MLAAYYIISAIGAIVGLPFTAWFLGTCSRLSTFGVPVPDVWVLWVVHVLGLILLVLIAYALLRGKGWARILVRLLSVPTVAAALFCLALVVIVTYPLLSFAAPLPPELGSLIAVVYEVMASLFSIGILVPVAIYWYMGRPQVRAYFTSEPAREAPTSNTS
jgi:hypothetical protein